MIKSTLRIPRDVESSYDLAAPRRSLARGRAALARWRPFRPRASARLIPSAGAFRPGDTRPVAIEIRPREREAGSIAIPRKSSPWCTKVRVMTTIGLIGAGHIGSQVARLAWRTTRRRAQRLRAAQRRSLSSLRSWSRARSDAGRSGEGGRHRRRHRPAEELPERPGRAPRGQDRHRYQQLLPAARRAHPRARQRIDDDRRALASAPPKIQGCRPSTTFMRPSSQHMACLLALPTDAPSPSPATTQARRPQCQTARRVRLRHRRRGTAQGRLAHPARYARVRTATQRRGAQKGSRGSQAVPGYVVAVFFFGTPDGRGRGTAAGCRRATIQTASVLASVIGSLHHGCAFSAPRESGP